MFYHCHCSREDKAPKGSLLKHTHFLQRQAAWNKMKKQSPYPSHRKRMPVKADWQKINQGKAKLQKMLVTWQRINCQESCYPYRHLQKYKPYTVTAHLIMGNIFKVCPVSWLILSVHPWIFKFSACSCLLVDWKPRDCLVLNHIVSATCICIMYVL